MVNYAVPFYENTSDNTHCFQACLKMIFKYFFPHNEYTFDDLDIISAKVPGKWTWPMASLMWCSNQNLEVKNIETFNYNMFVSEGEKYLFEFYRKEVAEAQIKNSDISQAIEISKDFIKQIDTEVRLPSIWEIKTFLDKGYLIICNLNSHALDLREGYSGHSVLVKGYDKNEFFINDPGLPGIKDRMVDFETFEKAWAYPDQNAKNIMAFRKKKINLDKKS